MPDPPYTPLQLRNAFDSLLHVAELARGDVSSLMREVGEGDQSWVALRTIRNRCAYLVSGLRDVIASVGPYETNTSAGCSHEPPTMSDRYLDFVFTGPPNHTMPQLIEVEDEQGKSVEVGTWLQRDDGSWVLRLPLSAGGTPVE